MLVQCWAVVHDAGPTLNQHWLNVSCSPDMRLVGGYTGGYTGGYLVIDLSITTVYTEQYMDLCNDLIQ